MENLGLDIKLLVAQIVSFGIFYFVFRRFISKPLFKFLEKQKEDEEARKKMAEELEKRQATIDAKDKKMDLERKKALDVAVAQSKKEAAQMKKDIIDRAKIEASEILLKSKAEIAEEREKMQKEIRQKIAEVSMIVIEKALRDYLTVDAQKIVNQNIIDRIPKIKVEN